MERARRVLARLHLDDVPEGTLRRVPHPPWDLTVARIGGEFYAIEDACPHSGQSLARGHIVGTQVICPAHDWHVCLRTGRVLTPAGCGANAAYEVAVEDDALLVLAPP